jgi:NAD+-dependent protein deacetylase sirtuin 4
MSAVPGEGCPPVTLPAEAPVAALAALLAGRRVFVLTGAGCSTASGIPDYRGPGTLQRARNPVKFEAFTRDPIAYRRYWDRATLGWPRMVGARPNAGHHAITALRPATLVTQNVDSLHQAAGAAPIELHGALRDVVCLGCGSRRTRADLQSEILATNPGFDPVVGMAPDGDADLEELGDFAAPSCACGGRWKPDVVFFGETVPADRVAAAYAGLGEAEVVLVAGSSLAVFSGWRFVKRAHERGLPIAILNLGPTRADPLATLRIDAPIEQVLPALLLVR